MWCELQNKTDIEEVVRVWRSGELRMIYKRVHGLPSKKKPAMRRYVVMSRHLVEVYDGQKRISTLAAKPNMSWLRAKVPRGEKIGGWANYGTIVEIERFPLTLSQAKSLGMKRSIQKERPAIVATTLQWEVLPPGWWRDGTRDPEYKAASQRLRDDEIERLRFVDTLKPQTWYAGKDYLGQRQYYVAVFRNCVVAESATYGNAAYVVFNTTDWRAILSQTKRQVLELGNTVVSRIPHTLNWRVRLAKLVSDLE
jgi:hypothetical protein